MQGRPPPLIVPAFLWGRRGEALQQFPPPPCSAFAEFLWPLLGIWKSLGNLKKKFFFESLSIAP